MKDYKTDGPFENNIPSTNPPWRSKRMPEVDLNSEAAKAATHYTNTRAKHAPTAQKHEILNSVAHGFYIGARWMEEKFGITK